MNASTPLVAARSAMRWLPTSVACLASSVALPASAHPGHGIGEASAQHLLTSPYHLAGLFAIGAAFILMARFFRDQVSRRTLQALGAGTLVCAAFLAFRA